MMSPLFESLVVNNLTVLAEEPDDSTAMVWNESEIQEELENNEKAVYRLDLSDKEILIEELEDLMAYNKTFKVKDLRLDKNEFYDEGVDLLAHAPALRNLLTLSLAHNKLTDQAVAELASSETLVNLQKLFLQGNKISAEGIKTLVKSEAFRDLQLLYLNFNPIGPEGGKALAGPGGLGN